jgi:translocation and assembly module TamA
VVKYFFIGVVFLGFLAQTGLAKDPYNPYPTVPYKTFVFGVDDREMMETIARDSTLITKETSPPESIAVLKRRAEQDLVNIQKAVASFGYYDAEFDYFVDVRTNPVTVYIKVQLNTRYTIGAFKLKSDPPNNNLIDSLGQDIKKVGISLQMPALKKTVQQATVDTINHLQKHGYPFARLKEDRVIIDRSKKQMQVALLISPGPLTRFGNCLLEENGEVTGEFIKSHLRWKKGEVYSEQKVLDTIQSLNNTRLFSEVKITHDDRIDENGFMNMYLKLESAGKNKLSPDIDHISGLGVEAGGSWERRNLGGSDNILTSSVRVGSHRKHVDLSLTAPDTGALNLNLNSTLGLFKDELRPYNKRGGFVRIIGDYPLEEHWHFYGGLEGEIYRLDATRLVNNERFLSIPVGAIVDYTDNAVRPKKGVKVKFDFIPYMTLFSRLETFAHLKLKPEIFVPLLENQRLFLRGWANMGLSPGAGRNVLPQDKKYYAGGGTHEPIRGYAFQMAGPLTGNIPTGGRSVLSFGGELYYDLEEDWSILTFADFGTTYDRQFPDFRTKLLWGVGAGVRYRTKYGTFYLDVASPVERRGSVDNPVEIYAGVKQTT